MQIDNKEVLDQEWIDLLLEALDMNISTQEITNFLKRANQPSQN
ncbi:anti-repressor SinI family protein [Bacillus sp. S14(2024)]